MIDTIGLLLHSSEINHYVDLMKEVGSKIKVDFKKSNDYRIIGAHKNLRVYIEPTFVRVEGSLPKYRYNTNLRTLSRSEPGQIIDQLSRELDLPLQEAIITRIDIAANIEVENAPRSYYPSLGLLGKFDRIVRRGTLYYEQGWCTLCFYDKIAEAQKHNDPYLIDELLNKDIMRYEIRYSRDWLKYFFKRDIKAYEIYGETSDVCCELIAEWYYRYEAIVKTGVLKPEFELTMKGFAGWCMKELSRKQNLIKLIEACGEKGDRRVARLKREVMNVLKESNAMQDDLVQEFDAKMIECTEVY